MAHAASAVLLAAFLTLCALFISLETIHQGGSAHLRLVSRGANGMKIGYWTPWTFANLATPS